MIERIKDSSRWVIAGFLAALTVVAFVGSVVGYWTHQVLFDTDTWLETVEPLVTDPVVIDAMAEVVSDGLIEFMEPGSRLETLLPERLAPLGELAGAAIETFVVEGTEAFFASDRFGDVWLTLNEKAHTAVVAILRDDVPFLSTNDGVVAVDLEPFLVPVLDGVVERLEILGDNIPEIVVDAADFDDAISQMITEYEQAEFPEHLNEVVIYSSDTLATAQDLVALFDRVVIIFPIVTLILGAAAVLVAPKRLWMLAGLSISGGLGLAAWMLYIDRKCPCHSGEAGSVLRPAR